MKKQRLEGIGKEIMRVISKVLLEEVKNPKIKGLVSVTEVDVTEDLKFADTYFSILPPLNSDEKQYDHEEILEALNEIKGFLRKRVAEEVDIRYNPEIRVKLDNSMENAMKITKLLNDLKV
ncbi:30S ribosome-binding factor RbfA [Fusobacterium hwasookii]|uniref:30S ribosome-binding factor RbfA n=1 Tax=Fusobacterium hwasookii TaxID=1583098 RepID=UPI001626D339|nr:30S ribosome-binding factor RbfA [Fusobacterium hwasookii]QNE66443.1 30S ribosome-binding factor RbfA [Fusobacterium hwasookii]